MPRRSFRRLLDGDAVVLGTWAQLPHPESVEILGASGFDYAIVDLEHGHFGMERATDLLRACDAVGLAPLARVRDVAGIAAVLDAGAVGVVLPGVESAAMAAAGVAATRYAPDGTRGACPCIRAGEHFIRDWRAHEDATEAGLIALVETAAGAAAIHDIVAVPGLAALMVGPFDLSVSMGHRGDWRHSAVQDAVRRVVAAAMACAVPVIMPLFDPDAARAAEQMAQWRDRGVRIFALGTDKILLAEAASRWVRLGRHG